MCGILGICGCSDVSHELVYGLTALQHRGQDSAGVITLDGSFHTKRGLGLVDRIFHPEDFHELAGRSGIGHVRYTTMGEVRITDAQPFSITYPFGIAMAHNGNVTNFTELQHWLEEDEHRLIDTTNDLELILYAFASILGRHDLRNLTPDDLFETVTEVQQRVQGGYAVLAMIANHGFLAFTDPWGIRPLVLGRRDADSGPAYAFASETSCLDYLGYQTLHYLQPGEAILVDPEQKVHMRTCTRRGEAFCVFEFIYFAREDSTLQELLVARKRLEMGHALAEVVKRAGCQPDVVIDVPSSAYFAATGLAEALGVPYRRGLAKNSHIGRSFIMPSQQERERTVGLKFNPIRDFIRGQKVMVVDDSIVRGTTAKHLVRMLKEAGAEAVYFASASPPVRFPCIYGIDMSVRREIIASHYPPEELAHYIGADRVFYQEMDALRSLFRDLPCCYACFTGEYPTGVTPDTLKAIERTRLEAKQG